MVLQQAALEQQQAELAKKVAAFRPLIEQAAAGSNHPERRRNGNDERAAEKTADKERKRDKSAERRTSPTGTVKKTAKTDGVEVSQWKLNVFNN